MRRFRGKFLISLLPDERASARTDSAGSSSRPIRTFQEASLGAFAFDTSCLVPGSATSRRSLLPPSLSPFILGRFLLSSLLRLRRRRGTDVHLGSVTDREPRLRHDAVDVSGPRQRSRDRPRAQRIDVEYRESLKNPISHQHRAYPYIHRRVRLRICGNRYGDVAVQRAPWNSSMRPSFNLATILLGIFNGISVHLCH